MSTQPIQSLFCERFDCPASEYEVRMFRLCLYAHARVLAPLVRVFKRDFFAPDMKLIRHLGSSTELREVSIDLSNFHDANRAKRDFWRGTLRIRVSGRKAGRIANMLLTKEGERDLGSGGRRAPN